MSGEQELIDIEAVAESLTGFDEIAIKTHFKQGLADLQADGFQFMRALYFVLYRRENGFGKEKDKEAYDETMNLSVKDLVSMFDIATNGYKDDLSVEDRDKQFANFVVGSGLSYTVEQYMALTVQQREFIIDEVNSRG